MKTIIKNNLKEDFRNPQLGLAVMVLFVVLILGKAIYPTEENQDLLISELLNLQNGIDKSMFAEGMREYNICYVIDHVFHWSFLYMILPLAGLPAIIRFCEENSSGFAHMVIGRKGTRNYLLANIISGSILAFITMIVVVLIFFLIVGTILPPMGKVAVEQMIEINKLYGWISVYQGGIWYVLIRVCTAGIMAAFGVQLALLVASLTENKFMSIAVPITILEAWCQYALGKTAFSPNWLLAPYCDEERELLLNRVYHIVPMALLLMAAVSMYFIYCKRKVKYGG